MESDLQFKMFGNARRNANNCDTGAQTLGSERFEKSNRNAVTPTLEPERKLQFVRRYSASEDKREAALLSALPNHNLFLVSLNDRCGANLDYASVLVPIITQQLGCSALLIRAGSGMGSENFLTRDAPQSARSSHVLTCTVVIPCWNAEASIAASIESVLAQEGVAVDCVVVDDGSVDNSLAVVQLYAGRIRWLKQANQGACVARNRGAALSNAEYVLFLDADDYLLPQALAGLCVKARETRSDMVVSARHTSDGEQVRLERPGNWRDAAGLALEILKTGKCPQTATVLWRRDFFRRIGGWNSNVLQGQDIEIALRALCTKPRVSKSETISIVYDDTSNPRRMAFLRGEAYEVSHLDYLSAIEKDVLALTGDQGRDALAKHYYGVARRACRYGWIQSGRRALKMARNLGLLNHPGNFMHQAVSGLIGLWSKERLSARLSGRNDASFTRN